MSLVKLLHRTYMDRHPRRADGCRPGLLNSWKLAGHSQAMNVARKTAVVLCMAAAFGAGMTVQKFEPFLMAKTSYTVLKEPLLVSAGGETKYYHLLPVGTPLYVDESFPEGHTRYKLFINIKGPFAGEAIVSDKANLVDPIWGSTLKKDDVQPLLAETPISKDELVSILKARKMTRDELAQLVRDWQE